MTPLDKLLARLRETHQKTVTIPDHGCSGEELHATFAEYSALTFTALPVLLGIIEKQRESLKFYIEWEERSLTVWGEHYNRTEINMNYPGASVAKTALAECDALANVGVSR